MTTWFFADDVNMWPTVFAGCVLLAIVFVTMRADDDGEP